MNAWARVVPWLLFSACTPAAEDPSRARSDGDERERAQEVCRQLCERSRAMSAPLSCEPPPVGCEEGCVLVFPTSMVPCMDLVEAEGRCLEALPDDAFVCESGNHVANRPDFCAEEARALTACRSGPRPTPKPRYVGPTPPRADPSRPGERFCTPLPGAEVNEVSVYQHFQARPAGWEIESIREENGVRTYCFAPIVPLQ